MNARAQRIVTTAIDLAEKGGFEAVRLRDVASEADVALGTLYRYFRSKEDLLIAALTMEVEQLEARLEGRVPGGDTPTERVTGFFRGATRGLCRRPRLARAILRAAASGDHELAEKVASFHSHMMALIVAATRGQAFGSTNGTPAFDDGTREGEVASLLQDIWFAALVGWAGGLKTQSEVIEQMGTATGLLLAHLEDSH